MAKVSLRAYNREIEMMIDRGHLDEAIANCRHILKTFPKHLETYRLLGKAYLEYKRYPEAADIFARVLASAPDDFVANVGMSIIRDEENKLDDAIWHMERAFETQPSNAAIQSELQRLYGRRDGVQPPRIRMTRGALAHMYVQGELYPQAISEIKSVLKEDPGRVDIQTLLARAYYRSGQKNEAADVASSVLRTYPHNLDANRVLMEILSSDRSESAQVYRQRVVELDPYAAHVSGTVFQASEAPEAAVNVERLDWNGQPVALQPEWEASQAISLEEDRTPDEQPDWLRTVFDEPASQAPPHQVASGTTSPSVVPPFDFSTPSTPTPEAKDDIPDFLRAAGWGESTGAFDESRPAPAYEEPPTEPPIARGDLPEWVKAMAPVEAEPSPEEEEELPDWINKIGPPESTLPSGAEGELDWLKQLDQPAQAPPASDQVDWPRQTEASTSDDQPDWLKGLGSESSSSEDADWMSQLGQPAQTPPATDQPEQPVPSVTEAEPDWLKGFEAESKAASTGDLEWLSQVDQSAARTEPQPPAAAEDQPEWLKGFGSESDATATGQFDWLDQPEASPGESESSEAAFPAQGESGAEPAAAQDWGSFEQTVEPASASETSESGQQVSGHAAPTTDDLGTSEQERDDSFAWLESLATKQGATEGLLTKPEERMEEEPDWIKKAKGLSTDDIPTQPAPAAQPAANLEELGKSEQEQDDSFAWLESLAAKQGATEGLLTKPEERMEEEPEWVKRAKDVSMTTEQPQAVSDPPKEEPAAVDDTAAWLKSLDQDTEQPAPPRDADATGVWLKSLDEGLVDIEPKPTAEEAEAEIPAWLQNIEGETPAEASEPSARAEEAHIEAPSASQHFEQPAGSAWMQDVEEERAPDAEPAAPVGQTAAEESVQAEELPAWMQSTEEPQTPEASTAAASDVQAEPSAEMENLPEWMQYIEDKEITEEATPAAAEETASEVSEWMASVEETMTASEPSEPEAAAESETIPAWLSSLEEEEAQPTTPSASDADLPAWLRGEEETVPEPAEPEPTLSTDWQPVEQEQPEPAAGLSEVTPEDAETTEESPEPVTMLSAVEERAAPVSEAPAEPAAPIEEAMAAMPVDPILGRAREDLSKGDVSGALKTYGKLIHKTRLLDEVIYDLREALYQYPVDVDIWQSLGDAYMRANRLQDALDAYTKAEELLR